MGKTAQKKKRSLFKTILGEFGFQLGNGPQKLTEANSPKVETERSATQAVKDTKSAHPKQGRRGIKGMRDDCFAPDREEHVEPAKRKKAMGHIERLIARISRLQNEIEDGLQTQKRLEQEIIDVAADNEQSSRQTAQQKRVNEHKQRADEPPVAHGPVHKRKKRSQRSTKKEDSRQVNNRKVGKKLCLKCKKQKVRDDFHKDKSCKDGLARWCKECKTTAAKRYRKKKAVKR